MKAFLAIGIAAAAFATNTSAVSLGQRAAPRFDVYLHEAEDCEDVGEVCLNMGEAQCCFLAKTPPGSAGLFASTSYADAGSLRKSSAFEAKLYSARGTGYDPDYNPCGLQIMKDDTCATSPLSSATGASVNDGSDTLRRRANGPMQAVEATYYFYRSGIKQWTLAIKSPAGAAFKDIPNGRRQAYLMEHGTLKVYL